PYASALSPYASALQTWCAAPRNPARTPPGSYSSNRRRPRLHDTSVQCARMPTRSIQITDDVAFGGDNPPLFIAGPCVIESREHVLAMARTIRALRDELKINLVFKSSFDKANRTSIESFRGPGLEKGLELLREVKEETGLPVL